MWLRKFGIVRDIYFNISDFRTEKEQSTCHSVQKSVLSQHCGNYSTKNQHQTGEMRIMVLVLMFRRVPCENLDGNLCFINISAVSWPLLCPWYRKKNFRPCFFLSITKMCNSNFSGISPNTSQKYANIINDKTIRSKRLMKELKEIQRASQVQKKSFSVGYILNFTLNKFN